MERNQKNKSPPKRNNVPSELHMRRDDPLEDRGGGREDGIV